MKKRPKNYTDQIEALLEQAAAFPYGNPQVALVEEAVRLADLHQDEDWAYRTRMQLIEAACMAGAADTTMVAFSWCLAKYDEHPEKYNDYEILWKMKWVSDDLCLYPQISLAKIEEMLQDMERRFQAYCGSVQPVLMCQRDVYLNLGDLAQAKVTHRRYARLPRCFMSDCLACEKNHTAWFLYSTGQTKKAIDAANQLFESRLSCSTIPGSTHAWILFPLLKSGQAEEAMRHHKAGYRMVRNESGRFFSWGAHTAFLALTGNVAPALRLIQKHWPDVEANAPPLHRLEYLQELLLALECLADLKPTLKLRLPQDMSLANESGKYETATLLAQVRKQTSELAKVFDERNGNNYFSRRVAGVGKLKKYAVDLPLQG